MRSYDITEILLSQRRSLQSQRIIDSTVVTKTVLCQQNTSLRELVKLASLTRHRHRYSGQYSDNSGLTFGTCHEIQNIPLYSGETNFLSFF